MSVLVGDTSGNRVVNATDDSQAKASSGQAITTANFRTDIDASGSINASDVALVKSMSGNSAESSASFQLANKIQGEPLALGAIKIASWKLALPFSRHCSALPALCF